MKAIAMRDFFLWNFGEKQKVYWNTNKMMETDEESDWTTADIHHVKHVCVIFDHRMADDVTGCGP